VKSGARLPTIGPVLGSVHNATIAQAVRPTRQVPMMAVSKGRCLAALPTIARGVKKPGAFRFFLPLRLDAFLERCLTRPFVMLSSLGGDKSGIQPATDGLQAGREAAESGRSGAHW